MKTLQMKIKDIKISKKFEERPPHDKKMKDKWFSYRKNGILESNIVIDDEGYLVDGYTSYLIAKADGIKKVECYLKDK